MVKIVLSTLVSRRGLVAAITPLVAALALTGCNPGTPDLLFDGRRFGDIDAGVTIDGAPVLAQIDAAVTTNPSDAQGRVSVDGAVANNPVDGAVANNPVDGAIANNPVDGAVANNPVDGAVANNPVDGAVANGAIDAGVGAPPHADARVHADATTIDATQVPLQTVFDHQPSHLSNNVSPTFDFHATQSGATFRCVLDNGTPFTCTSPLTLTNLDQGDHVLDITASNSASSAPTAEITWSIDQTTPDLSISNSPPSLINWSNTAFDFSSSDATATFMCSLDGAAFVACTSELVLPELDGNHSLIIFSVTPAGNTSDDTEIDWTVDTSLPNTQIDSAPSGTVGSASVFTFSSPDAGDDGSFECWLDNDGPYQCKSPMEYDWLNDGQHTFAVAAVNGNGGADPIPATATWSTDTTAPNINYTQAPSYGSVDTSPTFAFTADEPATFTCQLYNNDTWTSLVGPIECSSPWTVPVTLSHGDFYLIVLATDAVGNVGENDWSWSITLPYCGDGHVDPGEVCDDGNNNDGDACSADCQVSAFSSGNGSAGNPFLIANVAELQAAQSPSLAGQSFKLVADLDLAGLTIEPFGIRNGQQVSSFYGTFNGNGHSISNWTYSESAGIECVGFFASLSGTINDLTMDSASVTVDSSGRAGTLVGCSYGGNIIRDQAIGGSVSGGQFGGGLIGQQENYSGTGTTSNCYSDASVQGQYAGGLMGVNLGSVVDSYAAGTVSGSSNAGGLFGVEENGYILRSYSSSKLTGNGSKGGLFSFEDGGAILSTVASFWDTTATGTTHSLAGVGLTSAQMTDEANFSTWDFVSTWSMVSGEEPTLLPGSNVAPVVASSSLNFAGPTPQAVSLQAVDFDGDAMTFSILQQPARGTLALGQNGQVTYTPDGFAGYSDSFSYQAVDSHGDASPVATVSITVASLCNPAEHGFTHGGDGSSGNPYVLSTVSELQLVHTYTTCNYLMANDIDLAGVAFSPIGNSPAFFNATFDGGGHEIKNWTYTDTLPGNQNMVGLFEYASGTIENLGVTNVNLTGKVYDMVAGIAGAGTGTLSKVYTSGVINGAGDYAGGLVGDSMFNIDSSYSTATINGQAATGGLVGVQLEYSITNSYATGNVTGNGWTGGLVGWLLNTNIVRSYATGAVRTTTNGSQSPWPGVGGLVGFFQSNYNNITDSYATGSVLGFSNVGGLIGSAMFENSPGKLINVYATGAVSGRDGLGGLLGFEDPNTPDGLFTISGGYWDSDTVGSSASAGGGTAESDSSMQLQATYSGFDFTSVWKMGPLGYPVLR